MELDPKKIIKCPYCGVIWNTLLHNTCKCGTTLQNTLPIFNGGFTEEDLKKLIVKDGKEEDVKPVEKEESWDELYERAIEEVPHKINPLNIGQFHKWLKENYLPPVKK